MSKPTFPGPPQFIAMTKRGWGRAQTITGAVRTARRHSKNHLGRIDVPKGTTKIWQVHPETKMLDDGTRWEYPQGFDPVLIETR